MKVLNYSKTRENLASVIDDVVNNDETVIVTKNNKSAVVISLNEYNSWKETSYLLKSSNNAKRLMQAIANVESGNMESHELIEDVNN
ncbi:MAG: type II toxin-antitoxin system prevent-host-death family antitoxin [Alphaproteobacteria bacterium]|nr:type II toxin-antitoxin system prevent-host-death family antitoxin [Alphaproteobacteria bacterium]